MTSERLDRIVAELRSGSDTEENFHRLFDLFHGPVYRFFANRGFPADECLDLTQEVLLHVFRNIKSYRGESNFEAWLRGIVVNVWRNSMRWRHALSRSAAEVSLDADLVESRAMAREIGADTEDPEYQVLSRERVDRLRRAIGELPTQMRRALFLRVYNGLTYKEVADILGLSVETVKSHLSRGRRRLIEAVNNQGGMSK